MYQRLWAVVLMLWGLAVYAGEYQKEQVILIEPEATEVQIVVKAIPTTGFMWSVVSYDKAQFKYLGAEYLPQKEKTRLGAPLEQAFRFKLLAPVVEPKKIVMKLARAWEEQDAGETSYIIKPAQR